MERGFEHVPVIPIIVALIVIGTAIYLIRRHRTNPPKRPQKNDTDDRRRKELT